LVHGVIGFVCLATQISITLLYFTKVKTTLS